MVSTFAAWMTAFACLAADGRPGVDRAALAADFVRQQESFWRQIAHDEPSPAMGSRGVFGYALALCEARQHPERLERLFELAARMQDRDPKSRGYGNLWWTWRHGRVTDYNAVEFCMQDAMTIWQRHREWLPDEVGHRLREIMVFAVDGCLQHRVPTDYTNIAILNAGNLIVLGEALQRPDAAAEGYRRLEAIVLYTWQFGTHEFVSPTYYSPDLNGLMFIREFAQQERGRRQAKALFDLLWADIAANWFAPAGRLAGPHSRSYDYLRGQGAVDGHLILQGWLADRPPDASEFLHSAMFAFEPPPEARRFNEQYPRQVRQRWGLQPAESRTHVVYCDITLGCSNSIYAAARQDMPLTVDLPGERRDVRCYFIPDGRQDAYGKWRFATGSAGHAKALHLTPFWAGAQRDADALGLVVYRAEDLAAPEVFNVQSHFVVRRPGDAGRGGQSHFRGEEAGLRGDVPGAAKIGTVPGGRPGDGIWLAGARVELPPGVPDEPGRVPLEVGQPLVLRYGTAAVGVRVVWARRQDGRTASISLVDDGNSSGALRLTVDHRSREKTIEPGAVFWVRVGSGLSDDARFDAWRTAFETARPEFNLGENDIACTVPGQSGPVSVAAARPFGAGRVALDPPPYAGILELNGREIGRPIFEEIEPVRGNTWITVDRPLEVPPAGRLWHAERSLVLPGMRVAKDAMADGGSYVEQPIDAPCVAGSLLVPLRIERPGTYYLWARVQTGDQTADSLYVRLIGPNGQMPRAAWHIRLADRWTWQPVALERAGEATPLKLPSGDSLLQVQTREPGVKLDTLLLTPDARPALQR